MNSASTPITAGLKMSPTAARRIWKNSARSTAGPTGVKRTGAILASASRSAASGELSIDINQVPGTLEVLGTF